MTTANNQPGLYTLHPTMGVAAGAIGSTTPLTLNSHGQNGIVMSNGSWAPKYQHRLVVEGDADITGDIKISGRSLRDFMDQVSRRLAILTPDPARLERYEALRQAYEHYLTLEALLVDGENSNG